MSAADTTAPEQSLTEFAKKHTNDLWDVVALLHAVEGRVEAAQSVSTHDPMHQTLRLVQMARERIDALAHEMFEHQ